MKASSDSIAIVIIGPRVGGNVYTRKPEERPDIFLARTCVGKYLRWISSAGRRRAHGELRLGAAPAGDSCGDVTVSMTCVSMISSLRVLSQCLCNERRVRTYLFGASTVFVVTKSNPAKVKIIR
jgi:hypothetical protein